MSKRIYKRVPVDQYEAFQRMLEEQRDQKLFQRIKAKYKLSKPVLKFKENDASTITGIQCNPEGGYRGSIFLHRSALSMVASAIKGEQDAVEYLNRTFELMGWATRIETEEDRIRQQEKANRSKLFNEESETYEDEGEESDDDTDGEIITGA